MTLPSTCEEIIELEYDYDKLFSKYHDKGGTNLWNRLIFTVSVEVHVALSLTATWHRSLFRIKAHGIRSRRYICLLGRHFWKPWTSLQATDLRDFFAFIIRIPPLLKLSFQLYSRNVRSRSFLSLQLHFSYSSAILFLLLEFCLEIFELF